MGTVTISHPNSTTVGSAIVGDVNNPGVANTVVYGLSILKPDPMDAKRILSSWNPGTFPNKMQSIRYHLNKHGQGRSMSEYTTDGQKFYNNYADTGVPIRLKNDENRDCPNFPDALDYRVKKKQNENNGG